MVNKRSPSLTQLFTSTVHLLKVTQGFYCFLRRKLHILSTGILSHDSAMGLSRCNRDKSTPVNASLLEDGARMSFFIPNRNSSRLSVCFLLRRQQLSTGIFRPSGCLLAWGATGTELEVSPYFSYPLHYPDLQLQCCFTVAGTVLSLGLANSKSNLDICISF